MSAKRARDDSAERAASSSRAHRSVSTSGVLPAALAAPSPQEWNLLSLPREMRAVCHAIHVLDRQFRAVMFDVVRLTEVYLLIAEAAGQGGVGGIKHQGSSSTLSLSHPNDPIFRHLPPSLVAQLSSAAQTDKAASSAVATEEALRIVEARIKELEAVVIRVAVDKRDAALKLRRVVESSTKMFTVEEVED